MVLLSFITNPHHRVLILNTCWQEYQIRELWLVILVVQLIFNILRNALGSAYRSLMSYVLHQLFPKSKLITSFFGSQEVIFTESIFREPWTESHWDIAVIFTYTIISLPLCYWCLYFQYLHHFCLFWGPLSSLSSLSVTLSDTALVVV